MKKFKSISAFVISLILVFSFFSSSNASTSSYSLNRIGTRVNGSVAEFYDTATNAKIRPEGYNYTILDSNYPNRHLAFNTGYYDPYKVDSMLSELQYLGHNTLRVFIDYGSFSGSVYGVGGAPATSVRGLYAPYMDNFCDFLNRARNYNIYIIPILSNVPANSYYVGLGESNKPANVEDCNLYLLAQGYIDAKKQYLTDFVSYIKNKDQTLLSTIFAYELENEFAVLGDKKPFSLTSGTVTPANGKTYDMTSSNITSRQNCYDESLVYYINQIAAVLPPLDSGAKTMLGMYSNYAVGRSGCNGVIWSPGQDNRFPPRPFILANANNSLDMIDIHLYPMGQTIDTDLNSIEWNIVSKNVKPFLLGEFGAINSSYANTSIAASAMVNYRQQAYSKGFGGSLFWTWNDVGDPLHLFWTAKDGNCEIRNSLSNMNLNTFEDNFDQNNLNKWAVLGGNWAANYGQLYQNDISASYKAINVNNQTFSDFSAETYATIINQNGDNWIAMHFRKTNPNDSCWTSGYLVYLKPNGTLALQKAGYSGDLVSVPTGINPVNNWVKLKVEAFGNSIRVYLNNTLYINTTDSSFTSGYLSLASYSNQAVFDNMFIKNFIFNDNFNTGNMSKWNTAGTWSISNGALNQTNTSGDKTATINVQKYTNFSAQFKFQILAQNGDTWSAIQVRKTNISDSAFASGYLIYMTPSGSLNVSKAGVGIIGSYNTGLNPVSSYVNIQVDCVGDNIKVSANGIPYINCLDSTFTTGYCSLVSYNSSTSFDDVLIK